MMKKGVCCTGDRKVASQKGCITGGTWQALVRSCRELLSAGPLPLGLHWCVWLAFPFLWLPGLGDKAARIETKHRQAELTYRKRYSTI